MLRYLIIVVSLFWIVPSWQLVDVGTDSGNHEPNTSISTHLKTVHFSEAESETETEDEDETVKHIYTVLRTIFNTLIDKCNSSADQCPESTYGLNRLFLNRISYIPPPIV